MFSITLLLCFFVYIHRTVYCQQVYPDFVDLMSRDSEAFPGPLAFGHKFMTGGAGEGAQQLRPESDFEQRQQVKSDNVLPAYCEPPNPCPLGYVAADGCLEDFENSAEFSRSYQSSQNCICDQEHMFNCPGKRSDELDDSLQSILDEQEIHRTLIAKKFHIQRDASLEPRRKRAIYANSFNYRRHNPYLHGEPLKTVVKKNGRNTW